SQRGGGPRGGRAVPDPGRAGERPRQGGRILQWSTELTGPGDLLLAPQPSQQLVLPRELVPLLPGFHTEQGQLPGLVALANDQFEAAAGDLVDGGVILGYPDRVEDGQHADP